MSMLSESAEPYCDLADFVRLNTVQFLVDDQTKVEGKLTVGTQATVEYHTDGGKNIAVRVVVTKTSAMAGY